MTDLQYQALWSTWGEYFNYPKCCVEAFLVREFAPSYTKDSPFYESGFIPCCKCHEATKELSYEDANKLLGTNVDKSPIFSYKDEAARTISLTKSERFISIASKRGLDIDEYVKELQL